VAELEVDRVEARAAAETAAWLRGWWQDGVRPRGEPPVWSEPGVVERLARARTCGGEVGARAHALWRMAIAARGAVADAAWASGPRSADRLEAARAARERFATAAGFADAWAMWRAVAGETDAPLPEGAGEVAVAVGTADEIDVAPFARALAAPARLVAWATGGAPVQVEVREGAAEEAGRCFVVEPGRDVRVRVWRRPGASARGTVRVLLHELGHATPAARARGPWALAQPASVAADEAAAAAMAGALEQPAVLVELLGVTAEQAEVVAAAERALRARRRARLVAMAAAERAMYRDGGAPPWEAGLPWTAPGASHSYALAELLCAGGRCAGA
jgi:hypothetical protein